MPITESTIQKIALKVFNQQFAPALRRSKLNMSSLNNDVGYTTIHNVKDNYLSIEWFNSLFKAVDSNGDPILPNDGNTSNIDSIKAMFGFWTNQYISALGQGSGGGGGGGSLATLSDVALSSPQQGQVLQYDAVSTHWVNGIAIVVSAAQDGQVLTYNASTQQWVNGSAGVDMSTVWAALAESTNEQIAASHLSTALASYVTSTSLSTTLADYVTSTALTTTLADYVTATSLATTLASYASQQWVGQNYVSIAFFNRLFQAFAPLAQGETTAAQVEPNDLTTTIDNIKAMFGLWTEQYLSALGLSSGGGGVTLNEPLESINNASLGSPSTANVAIVWNGIAWTYGTTGSSYTLPTASASVLGGIKVGTTLAIDASGVLNQASGIATAGTYKSVTVDTYGRVTAGTNPTTLSGYGITDAKISNGVITLGSNTITPLTSESYTGTVTSVATGTGLTGGTITSSGTISISSTYQTYISHGESAYNSLGNYLPLSGGTITGGQLSIKPTGGNYTDGIRIHARSSDNEWAAIVLCGAENTGDTGTSVNTWFVGAKSGNFYIARNGTGEAFGGTANFCCVSNVWYINGSAIATTSQIPTNNNQLTNGAGYITSSGSCAYATSAGSATDSTKLPLTGGTLTGALRVSQSGGGRSTIYNTSPTDVPCDIWFGANNTDIWSINCRSSSESYTLDFYSIWGDHVIVINTNGYTTFKNTVKAASFVMNGGTSSQFLKADGSVDSTSYLPTTGGTINNTLRVLHRLTVGYDVGDWDASRAEVEIISEGNNANDIWLGSNSARKWGRSCRTSGEGSVLNFYNANIAFTFQMSQNGDFYASGGITALSDARHKDIIHDTMLSVEQIAQMPSVVYRWNDGREDDGLHVGSIAQNWQSVLPEVVLTANDEEHTLSMQYGVAACVSAITIAKRVVNHEARIKELEKENADLKQAYSFIKNAYDYLKTDYEQLKLKIA